MGKMAEEDLSEFSGVENQELRYIFRRDELVCLTLLFKSIFQKRASGGLRLNHMCVIGYILTICVVYIYIYKHNVVYYLSVFFSPVLNNHEFAGYFSNFY